MLATLVDQPFDSKDWLYETKWDGFRVIAEVARDLTVAAVKERRRGYFLARLIQAQY